MKRSRKPAAAKLPPGRTKPSSEQSLATDRALARAARDPDTIKAKADMQAFYTANPDADLHIRIACEAEYGLFIEEPGPDDERFIITLRQPGRQMMLPICMHAGSTLETMSEEDAANLRRVMNPDQYLPEDGTH